MVIIVERFGCLVGFNDYVMGLVVVAAGTSVPVGVLYVVIRYFLVFKRILHLSVIYKFQII